MLIARATVRRSQLITLLLTTANACIVRFIGRLSVTENSVSLLQKGTVGQYDIQCLAQ